MKCNKVLLILFDFTLSNFKGQENVLVWIFVCLWDSFHRSCVFRYKDVADLGYKWFALPGVSSLKLDCGGLEFSAIPFSGWYMDSEIVARYLGDKDRFNLAPVSKSNILG